MTISEMSFSEAGDDADDFIVDRCTFQGKINTSKGNGIRATRWREAD